MKHDNRMITAGIFVMNKACAPAVATVPIVLVVSVVETVGGTVPAVNAMGVAMVLAVEAVVSIVPVVSIIEAVATGLGVNKVAMLLVVEASVVNGLAHSPGKGTPQLAHSAAVV